MSERAKLLRNLVFRRKRLQRLRRQRRWPRNDQDVEANAALHEARRSLDLAAIIQAARLPPERA